MGKWCTALLAKNSRTPMDMLRDKAQILNYGSYAKKNTSPEQKLGRPRSMSIFEEFILTLMRLGFDLFQKDLAHRFNVSETTVALC